MTHAKSSLYSIRRMRRTSLRSTRRYLYSTASSLRSVDLPCKLATVLRGFGRSIHSSGRASSGSAIEDRVRSDGLTSTTRKSTSLTAGTERSSTSSRFVCEFLSSWIWFFKCVAIQEYCDPSHYVPMSHPDYTSQLKMFDHHKKKRTERNMFMTRD